MRRSHISLKTKLAAALLELQRLRACWHAGEGKIPYEHAKQMSNDMLISLFHFDHNILHGIEANDEFWNLTPIMIMEHREKSKRDTAIVAKSKRIRRKEAEHLAMMTDTNEIPYTIRATLTPEEFRAAISDGMKRHWRKRKLQSRPFPKIKRKFANKK